MARRWLARWRLAWRWMARRRLARGLGWLAGRLGMAWSGLGMGRRSARAWRFPLLFRLAARLSAGSLLSASRVLPATGLLPAGLPVCLRLPECLRTQLLRLCQPAGDLHGAADVCAAGISPAARARSKQLRDA